MAAKVARWLAPLALAAVIAAVYLVVHQTLAHRHAANSATQTTLGTTTTTRTTPDRTPRPRFYTVRPGDTLSQIAVKTGVSLATLLSLNPHVNPNTLQAGQRLKLAP